MLLEKNKNAPVSGLNLAVRTRGSCVNEKLVTRLEAIAVKRHVNWKRKTTYNLQKGNDTLGLYHACVWIMAADSMKMSSLWVCCANDQGNFVKQAGKSMQNYTTKRPPFDQLVIKCMWEKTDVDKIIFFSICWWRLTSPSMADHHFSWLFRTRRLQHLRMVNVRTDHFSQEAYITDCKTQCINFRKSFFVR